MRKVSYLALLLIVAVMFTACAKKPEQEIGDAKTAIDAAIAEGGEKYAREEVKVLNDSLQVALDEVKVQEEKFFKNFDKAKEMLAKVKGDAEALKAAIPAKKEAAKQAAITAIEEATKAADEAKAMLKKAPKGKGTRADIEALKADIAGLDIALTETQTLMSTEDFVAAAEKAVAVKTKAAEVSAQISEAMAKKKEK